MVTVDHLGQEVKVGDWAAMTQNNKIYAGKVIRISAKGNPTIVRNSVDEFIKVNKVYKRTPDWQMQNEILIKKFGQEYSRYQWLSPDWVRDTKFIKINPTEDMINKYHVPSNDI